MPKTNPINIDWVILLTRSIQDSETSIDFVQGSPGSRRERVNQNFEME